MRLPAWMHDELLKAARAGAPLECCGLIAGSGGEALGLYRCTNAAASQTRYEIDGLEQMDTLERIEAEGWTVQAIYHSHVFCPAYPSEMDVATAFYPDVLYVIVGLAEEVVRAFRILDGQVEEEHVEVT